jgi:nicotinamidase-related amidase
MDSNALLLIVDVQNGFVTPDTEHILGTVNKLIEKFRTVGRPVMFTRFVNPENGPWERIKDWHDMKGGKSTELHPDLDHKGEVVLDKGSFSGWGDELSQQCVSGKIDTVVLCGIDTDQCVLATAMDIFDAGLRPVIVTDACASSAGPEFHELGLKLLKRLIGEKQLVTSENMV